MTPEQIALLEQPLDPKLIRVKPTAGSPAYIPGWVVIEAANRIFGYDGWSYAVNKQESISTPGGVVYTALVSVVVHSALLSATVTRQDIGTEVAAAQRDGKPPTPQQHETAIKGAITDGIKRALRTFGDQFGLSLYNKDGDIDGEWTAWQRRRLADLLAQNPDAAAALGDRQISDKALGAAIAKLEARASELTASQPLHTPAAGDAKEAPIAAPTPRSLRDELTELLTLFPDAAAKLKGRTLSDKAVADGVAKLRLRAEAEPARWVGAVSKLLEEYAVAIPTQNSEILACKAELSAGNRLGLLTTRIEGETPAEIMASLGAMYDVAVQRWPALFDEQADIDAGNAKEVAV